MNKQEMSESKVEGKTGTVVINSEGRFIEADEKAASIYARPEYELLETNWRETTVNVTHHHEKTFQKQLNVGGECEVEIIRGDGSTAVFHFDASPVEVDGERCLKTTMEIVEGPYNQTTKDSLDASDFDDINPTRLEQIVQNTRVDAPSGEMPLNAIMLDLAVGHNELEQYKQGALSLHDALDERLQEEEEKRNPHSDVCDVLREVKKAAFGLYLRLQRGDAEITGERDGKYSNYFN